MLGWIERHYSVPLTAVTDPRCETVRKNEANGSEPVAPREKPSMVDETKRIPNVGKKRLLIIEDEQTIQAPLRARLEGSGYEVLCALDGDEGLRLAREEKPDLIVLDLMLPKRNGYSICRLLKFDQRYEHIPVLMLTARVQQSDRKRGWSTGADAYMTKPFESAELVATVRRLLRQE